MQTITLTSSNLPETVICPTSKSVAARALIIASLSKNDFRLINLPKAQDTQDLLRILDEVGLDIQAEGESTYLIRGSFPECERGIESCTIDMGEGGTTIRFLVPLLSLGKRRYRLIFKGRMLARPMNELYETLRFAHVDIWKTDRGVDLQGPVDLTKKLTINCEKSSQFASGLVLLQVKNPIDLELKNLHLSKTYFELTEKMIEQLRASLEFEITPDFSSAGYFIAYSVFTQNLLIKNIKELDVYQADSVLIEILKSAGAKIEVNELGLLIEKCENALMSFDVDGSESIDLVPTLAFIASHIPGKSLIRNVKDLIYKESDRLNELIKILEYFEVEHSYDSVKDILSIDGKDLSDYKFRQNHKFIPADDHRMVMIAALFIKIRGGGQISKIDSVAKSFPDFFTFFK